MALINSGRTEPCKDTNGGIDRFYIASYVDYPLSQIDVVNGSILNNIPTTVFYPYELRSNNNLFTERKVSEGGRTSYEQSLNVSIKQLSVNDNIEIMKMVNGRTRVLIRDNNGNYRLMGLYNGVHVYQYDALTGAAKNDLYGYNVFFSALERYNAPFVEDLAGAGIIIDGGTEVDNYIFQDGNNFIFQDGNNYIFN